MGVAWVAGGQDSTPRHQGFAKAVVLAFTVAIVLAGRWVGWGVRVWVARHGAAGHGAMRRGCGVGSWPVCQRRRISSRRAKRRARMAAMIVCRAADAILLPAPGGAARRLAILSPGEGGCVNIIC